MMTLGDWKYMFESEKLILAVTGLTAGLVLTLTSRLATNSGALPLVMVGIPALFYSIMYLSGSSLEDVRESGWVGAEAPSVPVKDLFTLVDFRQVRWDLIAEILPTWVGMIFVVSFASCLDVAAISIDMGEALDTNKELTTVGICNCKSALTARITLAFQ
jgi:MFS superfamily sulfate permease-like transporter